MPLARWLPRATALRWRAALLIRSAAYRWLQRGFGWWPLTLAGRRPPPPASGGLRLAYYHHAFPVLSETFIQREVLALRAAGLDVTVLSHEALGVESFDDQARALQATTVYLPMPSARQWPDGLATLARRHPLRLLNAAGYVLARRYIPRKTVMRDRAFFNRVVVVAEALRVRGITHVHVPWANPDATVAMLAARLADARYSVQARASEIHRHGAEHGRAERLHHAAFVITNTDYNRAHLRVMAPRARAVHVIRNGIDLRRFAPAPPPANDPPRLLLVGRLTEPKGIDVLLRACAQLRDAGQPFVCELVGGRVANEVNHYLTLRKLHGALGLDGVVTFAGPLPFDQVLARYRAADVVVLPALEAADGRREITPNVLLEAMAMQRPVVSTPVGGIAEIIEDGVSGLLVPPRDPTALAAALLRLLRDPALRDHLGRAGRLRVAERFDISRNVERFVELFRG